VHSFLGGWSQRVLLDGSKSGEAAVQSRVPQGNVIGPLLPLLFFLFINGLSNYVSPEATTRMFADECALYPLAYTKMLKPYSKI